eukprot:TRINITY_DN3375_c0_g2_i1.p1 TRINITY_DN3375_c0_g2~~TRINITY_DN3375_c0_g2_i1.p1  ORF type:complete len:598 (-),score=126.01 TRINITY_DN3375_c0_g2_i1:70-1812(-)
MAPLGSAGDRADRLSVLAKHVFAKDEVDIEDLARRAWPDASTSSSGCGSCGCGGGGGGGDCSSASAPSSLRPALPPAASSVASLSAVAVAGAAEAAREPRIRTAEDYVASLRGRKLRVYLFGELLEEPVDHPVVWPSVNAVAETYRLAARRPELATAVGFSGVRMSRFLHVAESAEDLVLQSQMQRELGRRTGTCFQRCVGMDAINSTWSTTFEIDQQHGTHYHERFKNFCRTMQENNFVVGGAMTDPKGDRSKGPAAQKDPDLHVRVSARRPDGGVTLRGAKMHQTGTVNSHWMIIMPGGRMQEADRDYAVICAVPVDAPGITYIYGRQSCDSRALEGEEHSIDQGNAQFGGQELAVILEDVEVPAEYVFMDGEFEWCGELVERFTSYHRRSYVCKAGLGDVLLGAAATVSDYNGTAKASHVKDKLVQIAYLNENIAGTAMAASYGGHRTKAGNYQPDVLMANVCKHNVTQLPYEIGRLAQDLAGGILVTLPSDKDFKHPVAGTLLEKYLATKEGVTVDNRRRILRLIENMTMGRNAVGYLTESLHGAGSPQAQRVLIARLMDLDGKKALAKRLAGIVE